MLACTDVSFGIDGKQILYDVALSVHAAEVLAVIGPNGAGKSTVSRILSGEAVPDTGEVSMNGRLLRDWPLRERAKVRAVLPQQSNLQFAFRVLDVVLMGRSPHSRTAFSKHDLEIARAALQRANVAHLEERLFPSLSGGERQRVQMARVLAQIWESDDDATRYLLLDEPTSALDLSHQHSTLSIARELANTQGTGVLVVLHDLNLAALYADRIALMQAGRVKCVGRPGEVLRADIVEEVFRIPVTVNPHPLDEACPLVITHPLNHDSPS